MCTLDNNDNPTSQSFHDFFVYFSFIFPRVTLHCKIYLIGCTVAFPVWMFDIILK